MLFDHDAKVSGDSRTFCGFARRPTGGGGLHADEGAARWCRHAPGTSAAGMGDYADRDAVLRRPRRAGSPAAPARSGSAAASSARSPRTTRSATSSRDGSLARCSHGTRTAGRTVRPIWAYGTCGSATATCCAPADSARSWTTDRTGMYSLSAPSPPRRRPAGRPAADRASVSRLTPYPLCKGLHAGKRPGSHSLLRMRARRSAAIPGTARRPAARPPRLRARCAGAYWRTIAVTMCPGKSGHK